jgi:hypothetical protein
VCIITKYLSIDISNITKDIRSNYTYVEDPPWRNKSNRLKKIEKYNSKYFDLTGDYSYDPDGNFTSLTRSYNSDNFSYDYYSGTNRLKKVSGSTDQYTLFSTIPTRKLIQHSVFSSANSALSYTFLFRN